MLDADLSGIGIPAADMRIKNSGSLGRCPRDAARLKVYVKVRMIQASSLMF